MADSGPNRSLAARIKDHVQRARKHNEWHVARTAIKKARREVMQLVDFDIDHPAVYHLDAADEAVKRHDYRVTL